MPLTDLLERLYPELHRLAGQLLRTERPDHTLQPTALINEVYLRIFAGTSTDWRSRTHFFAVFATTIRRVLIDHARAHAAARRGNGDRPVSLELVDVAVPCSYDELLAVDEALKRLAEAEPRAARVTELRFFAGLQESEIAEELGIAEITAKRDWKFARAWLAAQLKASYS